MPTQSSENPLSLEQIVSSLDAMQIAQLCAFALAIPQLYLCRLHLQDEEKVAIDACLIRLQKGLNEQLFTLEVLNNLLSERDYFASDEARLGLAPEPDFDTL
ncbi:hypothetical protein ACLKMH_11105 [Psychromonas sp. KJ10-10]|uniref:hypothetical protein n=1 Tax=Psychromonas sp. KJ10-10 TaxID=3391823 RepID=UPI0039B67D9D